MERIQQTLVWDEKELKNSLSALSLLADSFCVFDIETTGLSPQVSSLYLIGVAYVENNRLTLIQWFANDYTSEKEILQDFSKTLANFSTVVHYNGSTFDIPYLEKKYTAYHLPSPFENKNSLDIYRLINKRKHWFDVPNLKLTTAETLVHFNRHDTFTGKECIKLYTDFMQKKYFKDEDSMRIKNELLLHNHDDILGTILCSQLLPFVFYTPTNPTHELQEDSFTITDTISGYFTTPVSIVDSDISYSFENSEMKIEIPLYKGTLYHFFDDYKNYYYLPEEDMAIHKSVGIYVDASRRKKATAANCYTKKTGTFLPLPKSMKEENFSLFQIEKKSPLRYISLEDKNIDFSKDLLAKLVAHLMQTPR